MKTFSLTIVEIRNETSESCTLCFRQPGLCKIKYKAGQYITLNFRIKGRKYSRAYSLSSSPSVNSLLEITVKRVINGIVSNYICDELKIGDVVEVSEPMGSFVVDNVNSFSSVYLWGIGSGITPLFSIINELINIESNKSIHLIYGNKNVDSSIFYEQLKSLREAYSSRFKMTNFFSRNSTEFKNEFYLSGRINSSFVKSLISEDKNSKASVHFICGPEAAKNEIRNALEEQDFPNSSIFFEEFRKSIDLAEIELVKNCYVNIKFQGKNSDIFVPIGKSILDVALDCEIEIPYSCQTGDCNTCKAIVKEGKVKMLEVTNWNDDLKENEVLLCCSYPLSNQIVLEVI
jgi:ring-1,2-phenylacetyl-CoA epoxidase subunit PaaE